MNYRQIMYVMAIEECGSFTLAAKKLFVSQPSLSQSIISLEQELNAQIFDRSTSPIRLTEAGRLYIKAAKRILNIEKEMLTEINDLRDIPKGKIEIGVSRVVSAIILPYVLNEIKKQFPFMKIKIAELSDFQREMSTLKGDLDLFISAAMEHNNNLCYIPIFTERILLAVPPNHPLNSSNALNRQRNIIIPNLRRHPLGATDIYREEDFPVTNLTMFRKDDFSMLNSGISLQNYISEICKQIGFTPNSMLVTQSIEVGRTMAVKGLTCSFIPESYVLLRDFRNQPVYYQIGEVFPKRALNVVYRKDMYISKAIKTFIDILQNMMKKPIEELDN